MAAVGLGAAGCKTVPLIGGANGPAAGTPGGASGPIIRVFSDALPVNAIAFQAPYLWAGNDHGLVRWDVVSEEVQHAGADQGLPGQKVAALAFDSVGGLWVVTEAGLGRVFEKKYVGMPPTTAKLTVIAPLPGGTGAWAGGPSGLYRTDGRKWAEVDALRGVAVTVLDLDRDGASVWAATRGRGIAHVDERGLRWYGIAEGFDLVDAVGSVTLDTGVRLVAGRGAGGGRLLWIEGVGVDVMNASPEIFIQRIARVGAEVVLLAGPVHAPRLYKLRHIQRGEPTPAEGFRLLPVRRGHEAPRFAAVPLSLTPPPGTTVVATTKDAIWFGTESLGVARADPGSPTYYRSSDIVEGAERISVACIAADRCYVATGGPRPWVFDGRSFTAGDVGEPKGSRVQAVLLDHTGSPYAVSLEPEGNEVVVTRVEGGLWKPYRRIAVSVPEGYPSLTFASMSPSGNLWLGLQYKDKEGMVRPYGALEEDFVKQRTLHHRHYPEGETGPPGSLPINNALTSVAFDGPSIWFSSQSGVVRWQQSEMKVWGENEGLESELCSDIVVNPGGLAAVATPDGVGTFDGKVWRFPPGGPTRVRAHALARDGRGQLWVASKKGLLRIGDSSVTTFDSKNGLVEDEILDVTVDSRGRVWALGEDSITVVE